MSAQQSTIQLPAAARGRRPLPRIPAAPGPGGWRGWVLDRQGWLGLGGLLLVALLISLSASQTVVLLPQSVQLALPSWLLGVFGRHGIDLGVGGSITAMALMFVCYAFVVRASGQLSTKAVLIGIAALHVFVLLAPPLLSNDVFSYTAYGRMGRIYHTNPYVTGPSSIRLDHIYPYIDSRYIRTPSDYGPLFTALSYLLAPLTIAANVAGYKLIAALSSVVIVWVVWNAAKLRAVNQVRAVALVGLNPVMVVYGVGGGHNDMLMLAVLMLGVYVLLLEKQRTSGALLVVASAIKLTGGLLVPFALASGPHGRRGTRSRRDVLIGVAIAAAAAASLSFGMFGTGPFHLFGTLKAVQAQSGYHSVPGLLLAAVGFDGVSAPIGYMLDACFLICVAWLLGRVWLGKLDWITGAAWATVALLLTTSLLLPWYVAWLVPLAALSSDRRLLPITVLLTGIGLTTL
ncbi:MAG: polyprenol phosphomannose-dependent alpha 1,6 mannosyltransferase MptB [Solirubrobacteraceae bacterium]